MTLNLCTENTTISSRGPPNLSIQETIKDLTLYYTEQSVNNSLLLLTNCHHHAVTDIHPFFLSSVTSPALSFSWQPRIFRPMIDITYLLYSELLFSIFEQIAFNLRQTNHAIINHGEILWLNNAHIKDFHLKELLYATFNYSKPKRLFGQVRRQSPYHDAFCQNVPFPCSGTKRALERARDLSIRGRKLGRMHETLMIARHETYIDFYGASERWI